MTLKHQCSRRFSETAKQTGGRENTVCHDPILSPEPKTPAVRCGRRHPFFLGRIKNLNLPFKMFFVPSEKFRWLATTTPPKKVAISLFGAMIFTKTNDGIYTEILDLVRPLRFHLVRLLRFHLVRLLRFHLVRLLRFRAEKLFPGPHLFAGAAIVVLWAVSAALVPFMEKGELPENVGGGEIPWLVWDVQLQTPKIQPGKLTASLLTTPIILEVENGCI